MATDPKDTPVTRPIVRTGIMTTYGELLDDPQTLMDAQYGDTTHVPGFSDLRHQHDVDVAEGRQPTPLPVNMRWVRRTRADGKPTNERVSVVAQAEYQPVQASQVGKEAWLTGMPRAAQVLPDGTLASGDAILMVQTARAAARSEIRKRTKWLEQNTASASEALDKALDKAGIRPVKGVNPETTTELAPPKTH